MRLATRSLLTILALAYIVLVLTGRIAGEARLGWAEFGLIAFVVLFAGGFFEKLAKLSIGEKGFEVTLEDIKDIKVQQQAQRSDLTAIKIALRGLVTKYEYRHLAELNADGPYNVQFGNKFFDEITRLDDIGYLEPTAGNRQGFVTIRDKFSARSEIWFNLKEYMQITNDGRAYLQAREHPE
jgi:hypothetical protein